MARAAWVLVLLLAACSGPSGIGGITVATPGPAAASAPAVSSSSLGTVEKPAAGGCGTTPALVGGRPAGVADLIDASTPYVVASPPLAVAILAVRLRAGHPTNPYNKIAWVNGHPAPARRCSSTAIHLARRCR